jgi:Tfp pilus assembly protein PilF
MDELRGNNPAKAAEFFLKAIAIDPGRKHFYNNLAAAYMRMGEYSKAEEYLKISLSLDSNYARALSNMSVTLFHLGRYKESYKYYLLTKKADREYSEKRFEKKRVSSFINRLSEDKPEDEDLKKIKEYMQSGPDGELEE